MGLGWSPGPRSCGFPTESLGANADKPAKAPDPGVVGSLMRLLLVAGDAAVTQRKTPFYRSVAAPARATIVRLRTTTTIRASRREDDFAMKPMADGPTRNAM